MLVKRMTKFVFLIRAYNESSRIVSVIEDIFRAWYTEIVVVDDGSTDATYDILQEKFSQKICIIRHAINRGGGAALETGFAFIRQNAKKNNWNYVVTFDADGQMNVDDMQKFEKFLQKNPHSEVIFGSRFIEQTYSNVPFFRKMTLFLWRIFTKFISNVGLSDAHNGYRVLSVKILQKIHITMDGMEYASELIDEISRIKVPIYEVPVTIHYDEYTLAKGQRFGWAFRIAMKMIFKKFF